VVITGVFEKSSFRIGSNTTALSFGPSASCDAFGVDAEFGVSVELRLRMADASRYVA